MKQFFTKALFSACMIFPAMSALAQPSNDDVCNAVAITVDGGFVTADNTGATVQTDEVLPPPNDGPNSCVEAWCAADQELQNSAWFTFVAPSNGAVEINTCLEGTTIDTQVALWGVGDCSDFTSFTSWGANDDVAGGCDVASSNYASLLNVDGLTAGSTYYIQVDGYAGAEGSFDIQVSTGVPMALVNFIHNSGDEMIDVVDIWANGELIVDDLAFQTCTGYINVPADVEVTLSVNAATSVDDTNPLYSMTYTFNSVVNYIATVHGIISESGYTPVQPLGIAIFENALIVSETPGMMSLLFFHGVTDGPTVDLQNLESGEALADNVMYGQYNSGGYITMEGENFTLTILDENGNPLDAEFCAPFLLLGENSIAFTIVASGFAEPSLNSDGVPMSLYIVNHYTGEFNMLEPGACDFPPNDDICNATELLVDASPSTFDNSLATVQDGETMPDNLPNNDPEADCVNQWCDGVLDNTLWFTFTAPASGSILVSTCFENTLDSQVAVATVTDCNDFSTVSYLAQNDDMDGGCEGGSTYASDVIVNGLTPGNTYYIQMDGWEGETGSFDIQVTSVVGIDEQNANRFRVYPNPAHDQLTISGITGQASVQINDITGKLVLSKGNMSTSTIDISSLDAGVYTLTISENGLKATKRIVVE